MTATKTSVVNWDEIRKHYLPLVLCKDAAKRRNLDLDVAISDYNSWVKTGKTPCRATPLINNITEPPVDSSQSSQSLDGRSQATDEKKPNEGVPSVADVMNSIANNLDIPLDLIDNDYRLDVFGEYIHIELAVLLENYFGIQISEKHRDRFITLGGVLGFLQNAGIDVSRVRIDKSIAGLTAKERKQKLIEHFEKLKYEMEKLRAGVRPFNERMLDDDYDMDDGSFSYKIFTLIGARKQLGEALSFGGKQLERWKVTLRLNDASPSDINAALRAELKKTIEECSTLKRQFAASLPQRTAFVEKKPMKAWWQIWK